MIRNSFVNDIRCIAALLGAALVMAGCSRNDLCVESSGLGDGLLKFRVAGAGVKGALINNEEQMLAAGIDSFRVESWNEDFSKFVKPQKVSYDKDAAEWQTARPIEWKGTGTKTFFAYTNLPSSGATVTNTCTGSPAVCKQTLEYTIPLDAREQNDIMLGWYGGNGGGKTTATITFVHPLSSIRLAVGAMNVDSIQSITISGLYASGTVDVTYSTGDGGEVAPHYSWGDTDTRTGSVVSKLEPEEGKSSLEIAGDGTIGTPFIVIPQTVGNDAKVTVNAMLDGEEKVLAVRLRTWVHELEAGKTHVLTLGYGDFVFALDNPSDANLTFNNTGASAKEIALTSTLSMDGIPEFADWNISRVIVGASDAEQVTGNSWSGNGLTIEKTVTDAGVKLQITAAARTLVATPGSNDYWQNTSSRTDNLGWSPADWTTETSSAPIDLSKFDFETDTKNAHAMTTANCYIIRHAGTYKLPLVYGNAIVNGAFNEQSYYPNVTGTNILQCFQNHLGNGIISPFIEYNTTDGTKGSKSYLPASGTAGYEIVWQDKADIITIDGISKESVTVKNAVGADETFNVSYIKFTIPQDKICQNNAIIAVKDGSNIMWSWHIWTTNDPTLLSSPVSVWNNSSPSVEYKFFPLFNLGWIDAANYPAREDVKIVLTQQKLGKEIEITVKQSSVISEASNGCYYQFGRKDPMCTTDLPAQGSFYHNINGGITLAGSILYPNKCYNYIQDPKDWLNGTHYYNLWTGKKTGVGYIDQDADMIKTIYDPSPVGYKMPASKVFTGFTTTGQNVKDPTNNSYNVYGGFSKGWYFYTKPGKNGELVFFPAAGCRVDSNGGIGALSEGGNYWSAVPNDTGTACYLSSYESLVYPVYNISRAYGFSVRPVKE